MPRSCLGTHCIYVLHYFTFFRLFHQLVAGLGPLLFSFFLRPIISLSDISQPYRKGERLPRNLDIFVIVAFHAALSPRDLHRMCRSEGAYARARAASRSHRMFMASRADHNMLTRRGVLQATSSTSPAIRSKTEIVLNLITCGCLTRPQIKYTIDAASNTQLNLGRLEFLIGNDHFSRNDPKDSFTSTGVFIPSCPESCIDRMHFSQSFLDS